MEKSFCCRGGSRPPNTTALVGNASPRRHVLPIELLGFHSGKGKQRRGRAAPPRRFLAYR